jgi:hypothetical protein
MTYFNSGDIELCFETISLNKSSNDFLNLDSSIILIAYLASVSAGISTVYGTAHKHNSYIKAVINQHDLYTP